VFIYHRLYASDEQIQRGGTLVSSGVVALPGAVLLCVTTTAPVARLARSGGSDADRDGNDSPVRCTRIHLSVDCVNRFSRPAIHRL